MFFIKALDLRPKNNMQKNALTFLFWKIHGLPILEVKHTYILVFL